MAKKVIPESNITLNDYKLFIKDSSKIKFVKDSDYYLKQYAHFRALSDAMPCAVYILDYTSQNYVYVSESCKNITGYTSNEHMKMGQIEFLRKCLYKEDSKIFENHVFVNFIESAKKISNNEIKNCRFSINYRLKRKDGSLIKILQQSIVLETNSDGYPLLSLGIIVDISSHKLDNNMVFSISHFNSEAGFQTISSNTFTNEPNNLTVREKEIIKHITFGHNTLKIAELLNISVLTVNAHRRNINKKTNSKNVAELINFAVNNGLN